MSMREAYKISGDPRPVARETDVACVRDDDGIVHVGRTYVRPVHGGHNNVIEEPIDVTDCDIEACLYWPRVTDVPTCIECLGRQC